MTDLHDHPSPVVPPPPPEGGFPTKAAKTLSQRGIGVDPDGDGVPYAGLRLAGLGAALALVGYLNPWMLVVILGLVLMIFLHELGHFIMAKRAGMKVTEFFLCFGPKLWSFKRGETEYGIKLIPAGAYVKIIGMSNLDEVAPEDEARTYRQKSFWQRIGVAVAGSTMHFIQAGILIFVALVVVGAPAGTLDSRTYAKKWVVGDVIDGSGAQAAGLRKGDRIVSVDGRRLTTFSDLKPVVAGRQGDTVKVTYERDGRRRTTEAALRPFVDLIGPDGKRVTNPLYRSWATVAQTTCCLGIGQGNPPKERLNPLEGLVKTPVEGANIATTSLGALGRFFSPSGLSNFADQVKDARQDGNGTQAAPSGSSSSGSGRSSSASSDDQNRLVSIIGVVQIGSDVGKVSPASLIALFALVNISIGIINLVPLLPFDGGHVVVAIYERIQEKRLRKRRHFTDFARLLPITYVVVLILGMLFISTIYLDIANPLVAR